MRRTFSRFAVISIVTIAVSACSANHNSVYRYKGLSGNRDAIILVDAKQRAVLSRVVAKTNGNSNAIRRFCSEPSPDVFSVIAQSLGAGGSFGRSADPATLELAFNLAFSSSEAGSTIPRTQTINMLRELMFRTCERYLSGGYDEMELSIQAVRDQRLMVSILAIEQLTGAVVPNPVVLRASGSAGAGVGGEAIATFAKLRDEKKNADGEAATALAAYNEKFGEGKECTTVRALEEPDPAQVELLKSCKEIEDRKNESAAVAKETGEAYDVVRTAMETGGVSASTVADAIAQGGLARASPGSIQNISETVKSIVDLNFRDQTETMLFCMRAIKDVGRNTAFSGLSGEQRGQLIARCLLYVDQKIAADQQVQALGQEIARQELAAITGPFESFWAKVADQNGVLDADKLRSVVSALTPAPIGRDRIILDTWEAGQSKTVTQSDFVRLTDRVQSALGD